MDTITHGLLGMAIGEAAFRGRLGRGTLIVAAFAGAAPDLDLFTGRFGDGFQSLAWHRAESHSLILTALAAPVLGWLAARLFNKGANTARWSLLALLALWSHVLLDLCTSWGTEALAPFSKARYAWDLLPIIDPLFSGPLLLAALPAALICLPRLSGWVRFSRRFATVMLLWCVLYTVFGGGMNQRAQALVQATLPPGEQTVRAVPAFGTTFLWNVISRDAAGNQRAVFLSTWKGETVSKPALYPADNSAPVRLAQDAPTGRLLTRLSAGMQYFRAQPDGSVLIEDLRYPRYPDPANPQAAPPGNNFRCRVTFSAAGEPVFQRERSNLLRRTLQQEAAVLWQLAFTNRP